VCLAFSVYSLDHVFLADRLNTVLTMVLTAVAFKWVVTSMLPKVSYQTFLDRYVLWSFFVLSLIALQINLAYIARDLDGVAYFDTTYGLVLLAVWVVPHLIFWIAYSWNRALFYISWDAVIKVQEESIYRVENSDLSKDILKLE